MRIAFTSCMDATRVPLQPIWERILEARPDVLMLLGDQIYMDWGDLGRSNWARAFRADPDQALRAFAREMHRRYAAQWNVRSFRTLVEAMRHRRIVLTWDDHDFAWNNSVGERSTGGPDSDGDKLVPPAAKAVSRLLFEQFRGVLNAPVADYPPLGIDFDRLQQPGAGVGQPEFELAPGVWALVLDTRWDRTLRDRPPRTLLGPQARELQQAIARGQDLLIVAAGSPLKHRHLLAEQDWVGNRPDDRYAEFEPFVRGAGRPVLYLSGDIHRTAWGGRVRPAQQARSEVLQMLASPAAIGNLGPKKFAPAFGLLDIEASGGKGQVHARFCVQDLRTQAWSERQARRLDYAGGAWLGSDLDGESGQDDRYLAAGEALDAAPLHALMALTRRDPASGTLRLPLAGPSGEEGLHELDAAYHDRGPFRGLPEPLTLGLPEPVVLRVEDARQPQPVLTLTLVDGAMEQRDRGPALDKLFEQAFAQAAARTDCRSVVLFIHGLGKTPAGAIDQAYALRANYPGCEPVLFCWPAGAGEDAGLLRRYSAAFDARRSAPACLDALRAALEAFARARRRQAGRRLAAVVVARSAGAALLVETLGSGDARRQVEGASNLVTEGHGMDNEALGGIDRIVLSSPAIEAGDFARALAFQRANIPPNYVMVNRNDQALNLARFASKSGPALGVAEPRARKLQAGTTVLDFTDCEGVGPLHDYLVPHVSEAQRVVVDSLLCDPVFGAAQAARHLVPAPGQDRVLLVRQGGA